LWTTTSDREIEAHSGARKTGKEDVFTNTEHFHEVCFGTFQRFEAVQLDSQCGPEVVHLR
jgi:hypothetical protein